MSEFWRGKRVLVTGAAGFIGRALCAALKEQDAEVIGLDWRYGTGWLIVDIRTDLELYDAFQYAKPAIAFHLAAQTEVVKSFREPHTTYATNVLGTLNVLECCHAYRVESVVIASSDKAYGAWSRDALPYREDVPLTAPCPDPYSSSKQLADNLAHDYGRIFSLPIRVLRSANTYGPGQTNETTLITGTIERLLRGEPAQIHAGYADAVREWLYIDDAVKAYLLAAEDAAVRSIPNPEAPGAFAFNVTSGISASVRDIVALLQRMCGAPGEADILDLPGIRQIGDQWLDGMRFAKRFPHWQATGLMAGLMRTVQWHRKRREAA